MPSRRHGPLSIERPREPIDAASAVAGSDETATTTISGVVDHTPGGRLAGITSLPCLDIGNHDRECVLMGGKVLINLATGLEDSERVTVAFLVGGAALQRGEAVAMWLTKEAVRLAIASHAEAVIERSPELREKLHANTRSSARASRRRACRSGRAPTRSCRSCWATRRSRSASPRGCWRRASTSSASSIPSCPRARPGSAPR